MALTAVQIEDQIAGLQQQYKEMSRELSETKGKIGKDELADQLAAVDYQIARLEEQWMEIRAHARAASAGA